MASLRWLRREQIYSEIKPTSEIWWDVFTQVCGTQLCSQLRFAQFTVARGAECSVHTLRR